MSRRPRLCLVLLAALCACGALASASASAAQVKHELEKRFTGDDAPGGPLQFVLSYASDDSGGPSDGDVYVGSVREGPSETLTTKIFKFDEDGNYAGVEFDGADTPAGSISFVDFEGGGISFDGVVVDGSAGPNGGDVYVVDLGSGVVDRFDEAGNYICQITGSATPSASECAGPAGSATPAGGIQPVGLAIDEANGDLYVADPEHDAVYRFSAAGAYLGQITDPHLTNPTVVELDSAGNVYIGNSNFFEGQGIAKFDPSGAFVRVVSEEGSIGIGIDRATDHVFTYEASLGGIVEYDPAGNRLDEFAVGLELAFPSIAVNAASGRIYGGFVFGLEGGSAIFSPEAIVPDVSTEPATAVGETTASVSGLVDPAGGGEVTSCRFEYGPTLSYGQSAPCDPAAPHASATAVAAALSGLTPSTTYHYRLAARNAGAPPYTRGVAGHSPDRLFFTKGPPTIDEETVTGIERTAATLQAKISPHGYETGFRFEYVDDAHFQAEGGFASAATRQTQPSEVGDGLKALAVSQGVGGLEIGTTYHFRAVATSTRGVVKGAGQTFTTLPVVKIERQWAYAHLESATLEAKIDPLGLATTCVVQYVGEAEFQQSGYAGAATLPCVAPLAATPGAKIAQVELEGLQSAAKYHFRFTAANASGTITGKDETFTTFGIEQFSMEAVDKDGNPYTQAGGHPFASVTHYAFHHSLVLSGTEGTAGSLNAFLKDLITEQPPGRVGSTTAVPACPGYLVDEERCPPETQVGRMTIEYFEEGSSERSTRTRALYNVIAPRGIASRYSSVDPYTTSDARIRTGADYGTSSGGLNITEEARIVGVTATVWGVPADPIHDPQRRCLDDDCTVGPPVPLLRNPTSCSGPLTARARADTYQAPGEFLFASDEMPAMTGCDKVEFNPSIEWRPTTDVADSPTGLHVGIHVPQHEGADEIGVADLRNVVVTPAKGMVINPAAVEGLVGCTPAQADLNGEGPARCPDASKVGSALVRTPLLDHPIHGGIYVMAPHDNPFDSLFGIYIALDDPETGVVIKLPGRIDAGSEDGQLTTSFSDNPQLPIEDFELDFFGGPRAVLRTPPTCGAFPTSSTLTPWSAPDSGPPAHPSDSYRINSAPNGGPCPDNEAALPHAPEFRAGTLSTRAAAYSPFAFSLRREDGSQRLAGLSLSPPPGLLGRLAGIPYCPEAAIAAAATAAGTAEQARPACPAASAVGRVTVGAGAGPAPYHVRGTVYLAGPYRSAPLSLAVIVPAVAGPYDLGTVVVRAGLQLDLDSGQIKVESDPLPSFLQGVSLDVRSVAASLDRPGFTLNPTSCARMQVRANVTSVFGHTATLANPFQVGGCGRLSFAPKFGLRLLGKSNRGAHPQLRATLKMPAAGANIAAVKVVLPPSQFLDSTHIDEICTRPQFAAEACPPDSVYGHVAAWSPLLDQPLRGAVYMRPSSDGLPDLVANLNGQVRLGVSGRVGTASGGLATDIRGLPDAAVSKFILTMRGGPRGLLQNSTDVCANPQRARVEFRAQNGRVVKLRPLLRAQCGGGGGDRHGG